MTNHMPHAQMLNQAQAQRGSIQSRGAHVNMLTIQLVNSNVYPFYTEDLLVRILFQITDPVLHSVHAK